MLQLDKASQAELQHLIRQFGTSKAHIIRQLLMQTMLEDFPNSWHMSAAERSMSSMRQQTRNH